MNTALLIIDVQQSLVDEGIWEANRVIKQLNYLSKMARSQNIPVIFIRDTRVEPDKKFHHQLNVEKSDIEILKSFRSIFAGTNLNEVLKNKNISKLVVGGMQSDFCVSTACQHGAELGYDVVLVSDAHSTLDNKYLKAEIIVAYHNEILQNLDSSQGKVRLMESHEVSF